MATDKKSFSENAIDILKPVTAEVIGDITAAATIEAGPLVSLAARKLVKYGVNKGFDAFTTSTTQSGEKKMSNGPDLTNVKPEQPGIMSRFGSWISSWINGKGASNGALAGGEMASILGGGMMGDTLGAGVGALAGWAGTFDNKLGRALETGLVAGTLAKKAFGLDAKGALEVTALVAGAAYMLDDKGLGKSIAGLGSKFGLAAPSPAG